MAKSLKMHLAEAGGVINGWLAIPSGVSAEIMAQAGWDSLTVDLQHGLQDYASLLASFQALAIRGVIPLVRVPWNEPAIIGKVLDAGAHGVICPMVNTADQARRFVSSCRYPPLGSRSYGPLRAALYARKEPTFVAAANEDLVCMAQLETREALDNLEEILEVQGIDGLYIGPNDLSLSLGLPARLDRDEPEIMEIYETVLTAVRKHNRFAALHCDSPVYARQAIAKGFRLVTVGSDCSLMLKGARAAIAEARANEGTQGT